MNKLSSSICCFLILFAFGAGSAHALSCAVPQVDDTVIEGALVIFEGVVKSSRSLSFIDKLNIKIGDLNQIGGKLKDLRVYAFRVTNTWKGVKQGEEVQVLRNTYWG